MVDLGKQTKYWDSVANKKEFSHPIQYELLNTLLNKNIQILDYGCGYGRVCDSFLDNSYKNIVGIDISEEMIKRGLSNKPHLTLKHFDGDVIPFDDNSFDLCTLMAVLTCVPDNKSQINIIDEIIRVLKLGGILYLSDIYLQKDKRNIDRYFLNNKEYDTYGIFKLPDNGVVRHHDEKWIKKLVSKFKIMDEKIIETVTMNGNKTEIFQMILKK